MKILIIANSTIGLVKFRKELIIALNKEHEVYIATKVDECVDEFLSFAKNVIDIDMERRGTNIVKEFALIRQYRRIMRDLKPELVITYTIKPNIYGGMIARWMHIPYVTNITGLGTAFQKEGMFKKGIIHLYKKALKKAKVVFFENKVNQKIFLNYHIVDEQNTYVLNGAGVNLEEYSYQELRFSDKMNFLFLGRVMKEKGIEELFEAMELLHKDYPQVFLTVVGDYEENYKERISDLSNRGILHFAGWARDVRPYIEACICSVLPSYHEGMSNTLLECAAMGRPLIASRIPGCQEAIIDGVSGYCVNRMDSYDLYQKMKRFVELLQEDKVLMGKASREHIEKVFDKKIVVKETIEKMGL